MDAKLKAKWIKALRSGKYEQGKDYLYKNGKYCCLGVLGCIKGFDETVLDGAGLLDEIDNIRYLNTTSQEALASVNDAGVPFEIIAGLIHECL